MAKKQNNIFKVLIDAYKKTEDLQTVLQTAKDDLTNNDYSHFELMLKKATIMSTKLTLFLRNACNKMIIDKYVKENLTTQTNTVMKIDLSLFKNGILVELPPLINTRLYSDNNAKDPFLTMFNDVTYNKVKSFMSQNNIKKFDEKITICIINIVKDTTPKNWIPDIDNREYKNLINVIKQFFVVDDSSEYISLFIDTAKGAENKTLVYLVPTYDTVLADVLRSQNLKLVSLTS